MLSVLVPCKSGFADRFVDGILASVVNESIAEGLGLRLSREWVDGEWASVVDL